MTIVTHMAFGLLTAEFSCSAFGYEMDNTALALAAIGSAAPDIDMPKSSLGYLFSFTGIPSFLESRFGHRTITHSWIALLAALLLLAPLWWKLGFLPYLACWLGILSHILIDMANTSGIPLFWPQRTRWVFPVSESYRISTGSQAEMILAVVLLIATSAFTPISIMGMRTAFYLLTRDVYSASREARKHFPYNELTCQVKGTWRDTLLPVDYDEKFRVVAVGQQSIFFARGDAVFATGSAEPSVIIDKILVERERPTIRRASSLEVDHVLIDEVIAGIPNGAIISGELTCEPLTEEQKAADYRTASEEFSTVMFKRVGREAEIVNIIFCPAERLRKALDGRNIFVLSGVLTVTTSSEGERRRGEVIAGL